MSSDHPHHPTSGPIGLDLGAPIGGNVDSTTTTATTTNTHLTPNQSQITSPHSHTIIDPQPQNPQQQLPAYTVPLADESTSTSTALPTRPTATRRQTPRPLITRTPSSYLTHPISPTSNPSNGTGHRFLKSQREQDQDKHNGLIMSGTAIQPDYEADVTARSRDKGFIHSHPVREPWEGHRSSPTTSDGSHIAAAQPASTLQGHDSSSPLSTRDQTNVLPTSRTTHPEAQRQALEDDRSLSEGGKREKEVVVGREMEKAEGDRRALRGDEVGGKVVEGVEDDQLYALLRRFDQDVTHTLLLTSIRPLPLSQPDLRRSVLPNVPYSTDILKSNLERLYASGGTGVTRGVGELMRLRSWEPREKKRTAWFAGTYALAWVLGLAIPTLVGFLIVLVVSPESRLIFFPPVPPPPGQPPSAFDPTNRRGDQTLLGGTDSALTHKSVSEQKEEAAWEFRNLAETFAVKLAVSSGKSRAQGNADLGEKNAASSDEDDSDATSVTSIDSDDDFLDAKDNAEDPDATAGAGGMIITSDMYAPGEHPTELIRQNKRSRGIYSKGDEDGSAGMSGQTRTVRDPKTGKKKGEKALSDKQRKKREAKEAKIKRDEMVGKYLKMLQDGLGDAADMSEIMINALKPPPPYPPMIDMARYKLAGAILLPILLATAFVPSWIWARGASFTLGFLFFGQPVIDRGIKIFVEKVPNWREYLDMRNSLLYGVPTNDQLVLHLLRVGERQGVPLPRPPPPPLSGTPKEQIKDNAPDPDDELVDEDGNRIDVNDLAMKDKVMHKSKSKIVGGLKSLSKRVAGIGADVTVDGVKKQVGSKVDRMIWGDMLKDDGDPESYPCRLNGLNGHLVISPMSGYGVPTIAFHTSSLGDKHEWVRDINDIVEIKKAGISVPRAVLGWASGADIESQTLLVRMKSRQDRSASEIDDTVEVKGMNSNEGDSYEFQSVGRREQLFVRLLSMGNQRWESL